MLTSVALFAALSMTPGQGAGLALSNPRITYGELGSTRPDAKLLPGDIFFFSFDIEGITVNEAGRVRYSMAMDVTDSTGKVIFRQPQNEKDAPVEIEEPIPLGGTRLPARAFVFIGPEQPAGTYTCKVKVTDVGSKTPASKTLEQKFEVLARGFGIVQVYSAADDAGKISAPLVGVAGQALFLHLAVTDFARDKAKGNQPNLTVEMTVYDKDKKPTLTKPITLAIPAEAPPGMEPAKVPDNATGVPMRFLVPLNREGGFLIQLTATDKISGKTSTVYLPLRVFPAGS
jgi:hypothetical protein